MTTRHLVIAGVALGLCVGTFHDVRVVAGQDAPPPVWDPAVRAASLDDAIVRALADIEAATARKARVEAELSGIGERRAAARRRLKVRARAFYRVTRGGMLPLAGGFESLLAHLGRLERMRRMVEQDVRAIDGLRDRARGLREQTARLADEVDSARQRYTDAQARKRAFEEEERTSQAFASAFVTSAAPARAQEQARAEAPEYGVIRVVDDPAAERPGFEQQRGTLAIPVSGQIQVRDGRRGESEGPGLELIAAAGTPVRAAADGRVAFADRYGSYGRLVILDHGERWYTVYGGLGSFDVHVGDEVSRSARLGTVGTDAVPASLFFEVRRGTRTIDPRPWLGI